MASSGTEFDTFFAQIACFRSLGTVVRKILFSGELTGFDCMQHGCNVEYFATAGRNAGMKMASFGNPADAIAWIECLVRHGKAAKTSALSPHRQNCDTVCLYSLGRCREPGFVSFRTLVECAEVRVGPPATINREPRQARKGAAAAVTSGAGVWLARTAPRYVTEQNRDDEKHELYRTGTKMAAKEFLRAGWPGTRPSCPGQRPRWRPVASCFPVHRHSRCG